MPEDKLPIRLTRAWENEECPKCGDVLEFDIPIAQVDEITQKAKCVSCRRVVSARFTLTEVWEKT